MSLPLFFLNDDARILDMIRNGDEKALVALFQANRQMVSSFIARNNGTHDDSEDMLQEALIILWERVRSGKFEYTSKLSTFVYATVKHIWLRRLAKARREVPADLSPDDNPDTAMSVLDSMIEDERTMQVQQALAKIGDQCRQLLLLFYWEECSMEEIAKRMGFANARTAKSKKYQCKKALENVLKQSGEPHVKR